MRGGYSEMKDISLNVMP